MGILHKVQSVTADSGHVFVGFLYVAPPNSQGVIRIKKRIISSQACSEESTLLDLKNVIRGIPARTCKNPRSGHEPYETRRISPKLPITLKKCSGQWKCTGTLMTGSLLERDRVWRGYRILE